NWQIEGVAEPLTLYRVNPEGHSAQLLKKLSSWEKMLSIVRSYAPEQVDQWEKPAMAYQLRHLARRAVTLGAGSTAVELMHRALLSYKRILFEEPHRTLLTLSATYCLWFLPSSFYTNLQSLAMNWTGAIQKRRILQDHV
ncbi:MAG: glycosyltransferase family 2 protein, partial [Cyanobacteriota bacterium]